MHESIDTHIHIWNFGKARYSWLENNTSILARNYDIEEFEPVRKKAGITGGILMQAANNVEDTDWMLEVAAREKWLSGVVGWLPLMQPSETEKLLEEKYKHNLYFKGVRHLIHDESDPRWLLQKNVLEGLEILAKNGIVYDVVGVNEEHIETALQVAHKLPHLRMIFDHMNQPPIGKDLGRWGELMRVAATHPNFYMKISGLGTASQKNDWTAEDIKPSIDFVLKYFGEDRCCVGGDWPVSLLAGSFEKTWQAYKEVLGELLNEQGQKKVFGKNAKQFYKVNMEH